MADPDYFTLAELDGLPNMTEAKYTEARKLAAAAWITAVIERVVGTSFVPRTFEDTLDGSGSGCLALTQPYVRSITTLTIGGTDADVSKVYATQGGLLRFKQYGAFWIPGVQNVAVTYQAGYSLVPPLDVKDAALQGTRLRLLATNANSDVQARQKSITNAGGTIALAIADEDNPTGWPEIDAVITGWRDRLDVFGFA